MSFRIRGPSAEPFTELFALSDQEVPAFDANATMIGHEPIGRA